MFELVFLILLCLVVVAVWYEQHQHNKKVTAIYQELGDILEKNRIRFGE